MPYEDFFQYFCNYLAGLCLSSVIRMDANTMDAHYNAELERHMGFFTVTFHATASIS